MVDPPLCALTPFSSRLLALPACPPLACCDACAAQAGPNHFEPLGTWLGKKPELAEDSGLADALDAAMQGRSSKMAGKQPSTPAKDTLAGQKPAAAAAKPEAATAATSAGQAALTATAMFVSDQSAPADAVADPASIRPVAGFWLQIHPRRR